MSLSDLYFGLGFGLDCDFDGFFLDEREAGSEAAFVSGNTAADEEEDEGAGVSSVGRAR